MTARNARIVHRLGGTLQLVDLDACQKWSLDELSPFPKGTPFDPHLDGAAAPGTMFFRRHDGIWFVEVNGVRYEVSPGRLARRLNGQMVALPDELFADVTADLSGSPETRPAPIASPILLGGPDDPITVISEELSPLPMAKYCVLKAVADAYPRGVTDVELREVSGYRGAVGIFKTLRRSNRFFDLVLVCPGRRGGGGYRSEWPGGWMP